MGVSLEVCKVLRTARSFENGAENPRAQQPDVQHHRQLSWPRTWEAVLQGPGREREKCWSDLRVDLVHPPHLAQEETQEHINGWSKVTRQVRTELERRPSSPSPHASSGPTDTRSP